MYRNPFSLVNGHRYRSAIRDSTSQKKSSLLEGQVGLLANDWKNDNSWRNKICQINTREGASFERSGASASRRQRYICQSSSRIPEQAGLKENFPRPGINKVFHMVFVTCHHSPESLD